MHAILSNPRRPFVALAAMILVIASCGCTARSRLARALEHANQNYKAGQYELAEIEFKNALKISPENHDALAGLGTIYYQQGRNARALPYLLKAKELKPDDLAVRTNLGFAYLASAAAKEARAEAVYVLQHNPADDQAPLLLVEASLIAQDLVDARQILAALPPAAAKRAPVLVALGEIALRENRPADADAAMNAALAADPNSAAVHTGLGVLHWSRKELPAAETELKKAADLSPPRSARWLQYAEFKRQTAGADAARQALEPLTRATPDYLPAWVWLAELAFNEKKFADADACLDRVTARDSVYPEGMLLHARVRLAKGEIDNGISELTRLDGLLPKSPIVAYQLGLAYVAKGDLTQAEARLNQAVSVAPQMTDATIALAQINFRQRDYAAVVTALRPLTEARPDLATARALLAEAYRAQGAFDAAEAIYADLERRSAPNAGVTCARALLLLQQGKRDAARKEFNRALEIAPGFLVAMDQLTMLDLAENHAAAARERLNAEIDRQPTSAPLLLLRAKVCLAEKDNAGAETALIKALDLQPDIPGAQMVLSQLYIESNQHEKALARLQATVTKNPRNYSAWLLLGIINDLRKNYPAARDAYEKAIAIEPKSSLALNNLAYLYCERLQDYDKALEIGQRARALQPTDPRVADTMGWILIRKKQYAAALPLLEDSAARLPDEAEIQYHLGVAHEMLGSELKARRWLDQALKTSASFPGNADARERLAFLKIDPAHPSALDGAAIEKARAAHPDDPAVQIRIAALREQAGKRDEALAIYQRVLDANPRHVGALLGMARVQLARGDRAKALEAAKSARALLPDDVELTHTVGTLAFDVGQHRWSASLLQELAKQQPNDPNILFDWGRSAYAIGRVVEAQTAMQQALQLNEAFAHAQEAKDLLEMIALAANPPRAVSAVVRLQKTIDTAPGSVPALMALASAREYQHETQAARRLYEAVLATYAEFAPAQRALTILYADSPTDAAKGAALAAKARQAYPDDAALSRAAGVIAYRQGEFAKAITLLQSSTGAASQDGEALYYLGMAQYRLNRRSEGKQSLERALGLGLKDTLALEAKKSLASAQ